MSTKTTIQLGYLFVACTLLSSIASTRADEAKPPPSSSSPKSADKANLTKFRTELVALQKQLKTELSVPTLWSDPAQKPRLLELIQTGKELRLKSLTPVLLDHINYEPYEGPEYRVMLNDMKYPVTGLLIEVGLPAVPELIQEIISLNSQGTDPTNKTSLLFFTYRMIFEPGGQGSETGRRRMEQELQSLDKDKREALDKALQKYMPYFTLTK